MKIHGRATPFDSPSVDMGGFVEVNDSRAFDDCLREAPEIVCKMEHLGGMNVLGRTPGTMRVWTDPYGLNYSCDLPDTQVGRDAYTLISSGRIHKSSYAFSLRGDSAEQWDFSVTPARRTIRSADVHDCSPVSDPAFPNTSVMVRSKESTRLSDPRAKTHFDTAKLIHRAKVDCGEPNPHLVELREIRSVVETVKTIYDRGIRRAESQQGIRPAAAPVTTTYRTPQETLVREAHAHLMRNDSRRAMMCLVDAGADTFRGNKLGKILRHLQDGYTNVAFVMLDDMI